MKVSVKRGRERPIEILVGFNHYFLTPAEAERLVKDLQRALATKTAQRARANETK